MSRFCCVLVGVMVLVCASSASAQLLAYYEFEQSSGTEAIDSSGKENHGIITATNYEDVGEPNWVDGQVGQALEFNGDLAIQLPAENMGLRSDTGAIAFWLLMEQETVAGINTIWWGGDNETGGGFGPENEMHIHVESAATDIWAGGELAFHGQNTPDNFHLFSDPNKGDDPATEPNDPILMNDGQWHHIVCSWGNEDGNVKMYHNGALLDEIEQGSRNYALSFMVVGCMANGSRAFTGVLDDVQVYGRALTPEEVNDVMNATLALTLPASLPSPANQITEVALDAPLSWMMGDTAETHTVYFGQSFEDVNEGSPDVQVAQGLGESTFDPGALDYLQTYYWRVDEVEDDGVTVHRGAVWSFTTRNFNVLDDFEAYTNEYPDRVFDTWIDGFEQDENGAVVGYDLNDDQLEDGDLYVETEVVHSGLQAMPLFFDTDLKYCQASCSFESPQDWAAHELQELSLWLQGYWALTGSYTEDPAGFYNVTASGADIWGEADEFHFVYKEMTGAVTIVAHIDSLVNTNGFAKAGLMIRDTLEPGARNTAVFFTPENGTRLQRRGTINGDYLGDDEETLYAGDPNDPNTFPRWLKIERIVGGLMKVYTSTNGNDWEVFSPISRMYAAMSGSFYVGLAVTSHDTSASTEAVISNVTLTGNGSDGDWSSADVGIVSNPAEPVFVMLNDQAVVYHDEPNATQIGEWAQWNIPLQDFADQGVDLSQVTTLTLGVGQQGDASTAGGQGTLYVDDIRLYRPSVPVALTVENASFEWPGTGELRDFNEVPGWSTDTAVEDSGIAENSDATDGTYWVWTKGSDPALWQMTDHVIAAGDLIELTVDARNTWQATTLRVTLYSLEQDDEGNDVRVPIVSQDMGVTDSMQTFSLSFESNEHRAAIGSTLGIELDNATAETNSYIGLDNIRLTLVESH